RRKIMKIGRALLAERPGDNGRRQATRWPASRGSVTELRGDAEDIVAEVAASGVGLVLGVGVGAAEGQIAIYQIGAVDLTLVEVVVPGTGVVVAAVGECAADREVAADFRAGSDVPSEVGVG